jgi:hypothetical protein
MPDRAGVPISSDRVNTSQRVAGEIELNAQHRRQQDQRQAGNQPVRDHLAEHDQAQRLRRQRQLFERAVAVIVGKQARQREHRRQQRRDPQDTPGANLRSCSGSGPTPSGNRLTTMMKKNIAATMSACRRIASRKSRPMTARINISILD